MPFRVEIMGFMRIQGFEELQSLMIQLPFKQELGIYSHMGHKLVNKIAERWSRPG